MHSWPMRAALLVTVTCAFGCQREPELTPVERAAKDRAECHVMAVGASNFDPALADEPPKTISSTAPAGGDVIGSGAVVKGAAKGAVVGVVGGAVMGEAGKGAAAGAAAGALIGGVRRRQETKKMVTTTHPNPEYQQFAAARQAYRSALDECLRARAQAAQAAQQ